MQRQISIKAPQPIPQLDCIICMGPVEDPIVTMCGHLYCWACLYSWSATKSERIFDCPSCHTPVHLNAIIPLYSMTSSAKTIQGDNIPPRPSASAELFRSEELAAKNQRLDVAALRQEISTRRYAGRRFIAEEENRWYVKALPLTILISLPLLIRISVNRNFNFQDSVFDHFFIMMEELFTQ